MSLWTCKAVVFDSDGTLLNSFELIAAAYAHVAKEFGYTSPSAEEVRAELSQGKALPDIYRSLFPGCDVEAMVRANSLFITSNAGNSIVFEGLEATLQALKEAGLMLGIVTGGNHKIHDLLQYHDIAHFFSSVVHCDRVSRAKPHPEGILMALEEMAVNGIEAIMVGDTPNDVFAGKNAGIGATIGITHGYANRSDLVAADADYIVNSLTELTQLIKKLAIQGRQDPVLQ